MIYTICYKLIKTDQQR